MKSVFSALNRFFFEFDAGPSIRFFQIGFCTTLFLNAASRAVHSDFYFTPKGGVPWQGALELLPEFYRPVLEIYPKSLAAAYGVQAVLLISLGLLIFGVGGQVVSRLLAVAAFACHSALLQRNYSIVYGADIVSSFFLFGLMFMSSRRASEPEWSRVLTSVGVRLVQIQLCLIYGYTGFEKLKGSEWWDQTAVWNVLGNEQLMMVDLSFLRSVPLVIAVVTWGTVLFEVYFPALIWHRRFTPWVLLAGVGLHGGIAAIMGLFFFSFTMMSAYFLFLDRNQIARLTASLKFR